VFGCAVVTATRRGFIYDYTSHFVHSCAFNASRYTGKERDTESGNDYFGARYHAGSMGRFMSPDWSAKATPVPYAKMDNPQSLNLYAYVGNNPLSHVDPDGHACHTILGVPGCFGAPPPPPPTPVTTTISAPNELTEFINVGNGALPQGLKPT